jgi:iron complex transport system substrate-binding protein
VNIMRRFDLDCFVAALLAMTLNAHAERVVSLNLCTDQMLVLLAPTKVAGLTPLARDPSLSFVAREAAQLPIVRASAEAVLRLHPDLVLAEAYGAQTTLALLREEGLPVLTVSEPRDFAAIRAETRMLAAVLGVPGRGEALIRAMDAELAGLPKHDSRRALVWEPRGFTAGPGTLMDAVLHAAGFINASDGQRIGLEALLRQPPDLLVVPATAEYPALASEMLNHPAVADIPRRAISPALTICAGPFSADAAVLLAR